MGVYFFTATLFLYDVIPGQLPWREKAFLGITKSLSVYGHVITFFFKYLYQKCHPHMFFDITRVCKKEKVTKAMHVHVKTRAKLYFLHLKKNTAWLCHSVNWRNYPRTENHCFKVYVLRNLLQPPEISKITHLALAVKLQRHVTGIYLCGKVFREITMNQHCSNIKVVSLSFGANSHLKGTWRGGLAALKAISVN